MAASIQHDSEEVRAFLLGKLSVEAADDFESRLFADDELLRCVQEGEYALVDEFLDAELPPDELERFQELYRRSSDLQHKAAERRNLNLALENRRRAQQQARWRRPRLMILFLPVAAAAACVLIAVHVLHRPPRPPANLSADVRQTAPKIAPPASPSPAPVPVFFLADLVTRGPAHLPVLKIASDTALIELELELREQAASNPDWSVEVTRNGHTYQVLTGLHPERIGPATLVKCSIAAATLPDGVYGVRLVAQHPGSTPVTRSFRLERKK